MSITRLQLRDIFSTDLERLFSYKTPMLVLIKDRYLGILKLLINLGILVYFIVYVIVLQKAYLQKEYSIGSAIVYATGTALSYEGGIVRVWDSVDVAYPQYDPNAIVIATQITEQIHQQKGVCVDFTRPCTVNSECLNNGNCTSGFCEEVGWCSSEEKITYTLEGVENFLIWFEGNINFITMAPGVDFTTYDQSESKVYPKSGANTYLLSDILELGNIDYETIKATGGVIRIKIFWDCSITWSNSCSPKIESRRLDDISGATIGFSFDRYFYYIENEEKYRDYLNITGIKIVVESSGRAYAVTLNSIILNVSSALNLTMITPRIVDFLMIYVMKNRAEYRRSKFVYTKDLNQEDSDAINEDQPIEATDNTNNLETDNIRNLP